MVVPEEMKGPSACNWSPVDSNLISPLGSISMSTVRLVTLSEGGKASITPPGGKMEVDERTCSQGLQEIT